MKRCNVCRRPVHRGGCRNRAWLVEMVDNTKATERFSLFRSAGFTSGWDFIGCIVCAIAFLVSAFYFIDWMAQ